jgi:hypothetical protein
VRVAFRLVSLTSIMPPSINLVYSKIVVVMTKTLCDKVDIILRLAPSGCGGDRIFWDKEGRR